MHTTGRQSVIQCVMSNVTLGGSGTVSKSGNPGYYQKHTKIDDLEDPGRIPNNLVKNTKSRIRADPGKISTNYTPRRPHSSKIIKKLWLRPNFELILKQIYGLKEKDSLSNGPGTKTLIHFYQKCASGFWSFGILKGPCDLIT